LAPVEYKEALKEVDNLVFAKAGRRLNPLEKIVLEAAWEDKEYSEIASDLPCSLDHLRSNVGRGLWLLLTGVLGNGEKVTKRRVREVLEQRITTSTANTLSGISESNRFKTSDKLLHILGEQPPDVSRFYGRVGELKELKRSIVNDSCVALIGVAGIGKSALAAKLISDIGTDPRSGFDCLCWKTISPDLSPHDLITDLVGLLALPSKQKPNLPPYTQGRISVLLNCLKLRRCLLVLDGADAAWGKQRDIRATSYERYEEFKFFLKRVTEEDHQSYLVLTSRERFKGLDKLRSRGGPVLSLEVKGLELEDAKQILRAKDLRDEEEWERLIKGYRGNPLALELISSRIKKMFNGRIGEFDKFPSLTIDVFQDILSQQFGDTNLSGDLEKRIIVYLAEELAKQAGPLTQMAFLSGLKTELEQSVSTTELIEIIEDLSELSFIEKSEEMATGEVCFDIQPLFRKYIIRNRESLVRGSVKNIKTA